MDRCNFYNIVTVNGTEELDFLDNTLINFKIVQPPSYYRVRDVDLLAPDLIAYKAYQKEEYWWIICLVNDVYAPEEDLVTGMVLQIPDIVDIYNFAKRWRLR
jgi:hypothetical protein